MIPDLDQKYPHTYWCVASREDWPRFFETYLSETATDQEASNALEDLEEMARDVDLPGFLQADNLQDDNLQDEND